MPDHVLDLCLVAVSVLRTVTDCEIFILWWGIPSFCEQLSSVASAAPHRHCSLIVMNRCYVAK